VVTVRALRESDRPSWERLWAGYLDFYEHPLPSSVTEVTWQRLLRRSSGLSAVVAEVDDVVVGFAHTLEHASTWAEVPSVYLEDLFVDPALRGRGVGRALIDAVVAAASERGCDGVHWITAADNPARALYRQVARETTWVRYEVDL
jgi:GNAT superfamily N-acetyltransferase